MDTHVGIRMKYHAGQRITDRHGLEWRIARVYIYNKHIVLSLIGKSGTRDLKLRNKQLRYI